jgi:hypothetical protein
MKTRSMEFDLVLYIKKMSVNCRACNYTRPSLSRQNVALSHGKISTTMHASLELLAKLVCVDAALQDKGVRVPELGAGRHAW